MQAGGRTYDSDFKAEAVRLAIERNNVASVARELGIASSTLQRWVNNSREQPENLMPGDGNDMVQSSTMTENKCDWCGNSCGTKKYCCKKCEFESDKFDEKRKTESSSSTSSSTTISNQSSTDVRINVLDEPLSFLVSECKHLLALIPVLAIHLAFMNMEPYKTFCQYLPTQYHNSSLDDGLSGSTNNVISFILSFLPLGISATLIFRFFEYFLLILAIVVGIGLIMAGIASWGVWTVVGIIVIALVIWFGLAVLFA